MTKPFKQNQIYVTFQERPIKEYNEHTGSYEVVGYDNPLGFMHIYNPKKPDDKKHHTQREWAYSLEYGMRFELRFGEWWATGTRRTWVPGTGYTTEPVDEKIKPQPQIYDNIPLNGFKIQKFVSRYSTSNKVWRILDPRGFELEISTASLDDIIQNSDILKGGIIAEKCYWYSNKNLKVYK